MWALGLLSAFLWIRRAGPSIGIDRAQVYSLSIFLAAGVLLGGRLVEVVFSPATGAQWAFGFRYADKAAYAEYVDRYEDFKASLEQYAD